MDRRRLIFTGLLALAGHAVAATPTRLDATIDHATVVYGGTSSLAVVMTYAGPPCPSSLTPVTGTLVLKGDGIELMRIENFYLAFDRGCHDGTYTAGRDFTLPQDAPFGTHAYTVEFLGNAELAPAISAPAVQTVTPSLAFPGPADGLVKAGVAGTTNYGYPGWSCIDKALAAGSAPAPLPPGVQAAYGMVKVELSRCSFECPFICTLDTPNVPMQRVLIEAPQPIAPGSVWVYAAAAGDPTPAWRPVSADISGRQASFLLAGNGSPIGVIQVHDINAYVAIASTPAPSTALQDLWWGGAAENGWGVSLAQSGDPLFGGFYIYRGDGSPTWVMMSGGSWNAAHTVFSGALHSPMGAWFGNYDASKLQVGSPIGSARFTFSGTSAATLDVTLGTLNVSKALQRFAISTGASRVYGGMWWGGEQQNGWGLFLQQQGQKLFAVWYTYDANRQPAWFVMTDATIQPSTTTRDYATVEGTAYRTSSSPWTSAYDPSRYAAQPVGTMRFDLYGPDAGRFTYSIDGVSGAKTLYRFPF